MRSTIVLVAHRFVVTLVVTVNAVILHNKIFPKHFEICRSTPWYSSGNFIFVKWQFFCVECQFYCHLVHRASRSLCFHRSMHSRSNSTRPSRHGRGSGDTTETLVKEREEEGHRPHTLV